MMRRHVALVALFLSIAVGLAAAEDVSDDPVDTCRSPPRTQREEIDVKPRQFNAASASTSEVEVSPGPAIVRDRSGSCFHRGTDRRCEICCNGHCCEEISDEYQLLPQGHQLWIPVRIIHVVFPSASGVIMTEAELDAAFMQLNKVFAVAKMAFFLHSYELVRNTADAAACVTDPCYSSEDCSFYTKLLPTHAESPQDIINVVICALPYLGEAQWPWATGENDIRQYVQMAERTIPGRTSTSEGKTFVHEMGHFFGLLHTFEGGCEGPGDYIGDTPASSSAVRRTDPCGTNLDTCSGVPGLDSTDNYMNYAQDACMTSFTGEQIRRMQRAASKYRPRMLHKYLVQGKCPPSARNLSDCACSDPDLDPMQHCAGQSVTFSRYIASSSSPLRVIGALAAAGVTLVLAFV